MRTLMTAFWLGRTDELGSRGRGICCRRNHVLIAPSSSRDLELSHDPQRQVLQVRQLRQDQPLRVVNQRDAGTLRASG